MLRNAIAACLGILITASTVRAGGPRDHEPGFFLRLSTGIGGAKTAADDGLVEARLSGLSGDPNFAIGGTITPNFALHATLWGWSVGDPTLEVNGVEAALNSSKVTLGALGIGITYYFMPVNLYLSPSIGFGALNFEVLGIDAESDTGVAFDFSVGKEWWVSDRWALGIAGGLGLHSIPDGGDDWKGSSFAVRFTSTFN